MKYFLRSNSNELETTEQSPSGVYVETDKKKGKVKKLKKKAPKTKKSQKKQLKNVNNKKKNTFDQESKCSQKNTVKHY